jgi:hypothetical protein
MSSYLPTVESDSAGALRIALAGIGPPSIIWDRVDITLSTSTPSISIGSNASITWTGYYEYDHTPFSGTIVLNGTTVKDTPGVYTYTVNKIIDTKYDLTAFTSNSVPVEFLSSQPSTTSTSTGTTTTSSATSMTSGAGGIPEFPYQLIAAAVLIVVVALSYLVVRRRQGVRAPT